MNATETERRTEQAPNGACSPLTSVQHLETNLCRFECQTRCQHILHARFERERRAIFEALIADPADAFERRAFRICNCCQWPVVYVRDDGKPSVHLARCRDRLCPLCSSARSRESASRVASIVARMDAPRFMTLTMPHFDAPLDVQLNRLMNTFRELRGTDAWKSIVLGGVWSLELTYNSERNEWHPHVHIIFDGSYFPQPTLKALWSQIHGANVIVDVRAVSSTRAAASYLAKYVSKVVDVESWGEEQIREYAAAMHRRRTIHTFGNCHGSTAEADPDDDTPTASTKTIGVWVIRKRMRLGDEHARRTAEALASSGGVLTLLLADDLTNPVTLTGDHLTTRLMEAARWLRDLDPTDAACWKPPRTDVQVHRPTRTPDRSLTEPPWHEPEAARL